MVGSQPNSHQPYRIYTVAVAADDGATFKLTEAFDGTAAAAALTIVRDGVPHLYVETVADGQAAWTYDIFFTGPHLANVPELAIVDEGTGEPCPPCSSCSDIDSCVSGQNNYLFVLLASVSKQLPL